MVTNRCNLSCSYCVLENAPHQLRAELDLQSKKEFVSHLYQKLDFRRLTLSGGEVVIMGKRPPSEFIELLRYVRSFRFPVREKNLEIEIYTNGTFLEEKVISEMEGVVDMVAVTIDGVQDKFFTSIGRNNQKFSQYFDRIVHVCRLLSKSGIELKLHSVISQKNHSALADELPFILDSIENAGGNISLWKFYQYMSYDDPKKDKQHAISKELYEDFANRARKVLEGRNIPFHFKANGEMHASLFNILSYGNAQYMKDGDTWLTSRRTNDLRSYESMEELFQKHDIDETRFRQFHEIKR